MSKYFDCDKHESEDSVLPDGAFNLELWATYKTFRKQRALEPVFTFYEALHHFHRTA